MVKSKDIGRSGNENHRKKRRRTGRLGSKLRELDEEHKSALKSAESTKALLTEDAGYMEAEGMERTYKFNQDDIVKEVDASTARKRFKLKLDQYGPYTINYTRNGRELIIGGKKGHVAAFDWQLGKLDCELFLNETVHAVQFLHNDRSIITHFVST